MGFELPKVKKFLCCLELETGGIIIGWIAAIFSALGVFLLSALLILTIIGFINDVNKDVEGHLITFIVICVVWAIYVIYFCFVFYAAVQLIRGTKNRNHRQMKFYLILMGIGVVMSFLQIFSAGLNGLARSILSAIISAYFFICIYSLYEMVKVSST